MKNRFLIALLLLAAGMLSPSGLRSQIYRIELSSNPLGFRYEPLSDSSMVLPVLSGLCRRYILAGYLECNADSLVWAGATVKAYIHTGPEYKIRRLRILSDSADPVFAGIRNRYLNSAFDTLKSTRIADEILNDLENSGYPFSVLRTEASIENDGVEAVFHIDKGDYFVFDTAHIDGEQVLRKSFIEAYTGIRHGNPYNEALFRKAHEKLNQLPFLYSERVPQLVFMYGGIARPYYYLKKKRSDQVNGIIGLAPGPSSGNNASTVVLTGEFALRLNNLFRSAKTLNIHWRSFQARSQELKAGFTYPYILARPVGAELGVELLKYDTLYTVFQRQLGIQYFTSGVNGFKAFYKVSSTNLNSVDTAQIRNSRQFPAINAIELKQYGLSALFNTLNYRFNPRRGYLLEATASVGSKTVLRDNQIAELRFGSSGYTLYDSNRLKSTQYQYQLRTEKFFAAGRNGTFRMGFYATRIFAPEIYFNELLREGGINSLKGFNEQSIFASNFNMLELEYRYLLNMNSHLRVFWNGAYYEDRSYGRGAPVSDKPWGFGVGGNIQTGAGILTLIYALGREKNNSFDLKAGKFHFGLSSYF